MCPNFETAHIQPQGRGGYELGVPYEASTGVQTRSSNKVFNIDVECIDIKLYI